MYKVPSAKPVALPQVNHESGQYDEGNYVTMYPRAPKNTHILNKNVGRLDIEDECDKTYAAPTSRLVFR